MPVSPPPQSKDSVLNNFLQAIWRTLAIESATTVARPANNWIGRTLFDTTLGIPIWWNGADWVDATGAIV